MPTPKLDTKLLQEALNLLEEYKSPDLALKAKATNLPASTLMHRARLARLAGMTPTVRKDAPRIYTRQRLGKMHLVIPDTQVKPGVNTDHLEWAGNYASEKKPDTIVMIGDWFDMPSLCSFDRGKLDFEGRRYMEDIKAGRRAMERFLKPILRVKGYAPAMHFFTGNHEYRVSRFTQDNPELLGKLDEKDFGLADYGWKVHPFLKPATLDGISYCHYFTSGPMGRPVASAAALLRVRQESCTQGHVQHTDLAFHPKTQNIGLFAGTFYSHDENYLGYQGNNQRRQIVVKHEVEHGRYDPMFVSLRFLEKGYS
jgi:hypothetical protein